jgi:hypothetical protein
MGKRLIEFTLGFLGYLVYLRMGAIPIAAKSANDDHILKFPTHATTPAVLAKGEASAS